MSNDTTTTPNSFRPSLHQHLRAVGRARYGVESAIDTLAGILLDTIPEGEEWDEHPLDEVREALQGIDEKLAEFAAGLEAQGADIEKDDPVEFDEEPVDPHFHEVEQSIAIGDATRNINKKRNTRGS